MSTQAAAIGGEIRLVDLSREYGVVRAVSKVNLTAGRGEFVTLLGASGSGKTTTLMMIAGFVTPSSGDIRLDGTSIVARPPDKRNLGVVFQSYALFPHMNVAENVGFPLRMRRLDKAATERRVSEALAMVQLEGLGERRITQLSGGQQQRVALARALVFRPPVLLMDEPLGALDRQLREQMQSEIRRIQKSLGLTVIYVTHDQEEALILSDRIAIMQAGQMLQIGPPEAVYERPDSAYIAGFLGEANFLAGRIETKDTQGAKIRLDGGALIEATDSGFGVGSRVLALVRPEALVLATSGLGQGMNALPATIEKREYLGQSIRYIARAGTDRLIVREPRREATLRAMAGDSVILSWPRSATRLFAEESSGRNVIFSN